MCWVGLDGVGWGGTYWGVGHLGVGCVGWSRMCWDGMKNEVGWGGCWGMHSSFRRECFLGRRIASRSAFYVYVAPRQATHAQSP